MPLGILFWVVYVIAIVFGFWSNYEAAQPMWFRRAGAYLVLWLLVGVLGWEVFGPVVHR
jgi:membrane protein YdbS with pleckstrin-like domain